MPTGAYIMGLAGTLLGDEAHVRWPLRELADYINESVKAVLLAKPSAYSSTRILSLVEGTHQSVPQSGTPKPLRLLNIVRNLSTASTDANRIGGRVVRATSRALLDAQDPEWHVKERTQFRFQRDVRQFVFDEENPLEYYVWPGNDGNGKVEGLLSELPTPLTAVPNVDASTLPAWTGDIGLSELYSVPVLHHTCYLAQIKDSVEGFTARANDHYRKFADAVGLKIQVEAATSPNQRRRGDGS